MSETQSGNSLDYRVQVYMHVYLDPISIMQCVGELLYYNTTKNI